MHRPGGRFHGLQTVREIEEVEFFNNSDGSGIVFSLIEVVQKNKQFLSDIDGKIGDGDHGINMNKGFTLCGETLEKDPGNLSHSFMVLYRILMGNIGGSMGPLYGQFFRAMGKACRDKEVIDADVFRQMIAGAREGISSISEAKVGDKTMMDVLIPAAEAYEKALQNGEGFSDALGAMTRAARCGRDSTIGMISRVGRSSRLGERSRGVMDAGAASCCLILESMAESIRALLIISMED